MSCVAEQFLARTSHTVAIVMHRCCSERKVYDGWRDGIFNYSDTFLMTHEVGFSYTKGLVLRSLTLTAHYGTMGEAYKIGGTDKLPFSASTHR
jgi:hypothetical protein